MSKEQVLSIYGSHDAAATFIDKDDNIKVLEYERFVNKRYGSFKKTMDARGPKMGSNDEERSAFLEYIKANTKEKIATVIYNELNPEDISFIAEHFPKCEFIRMEHHRAHAASGYFQSGFDKAIILSIDGGGNDFDEIIYTASYLAEDDKIKTIQTYEFINLGVAYGHIGMPISEIKPGPDSDAHSLVYAGKVMGLCAYGEVRKDWVEPMHDYYKHMSLETLGRDIKLDLSFDSLEGMNSYDLAATSQYVFETIAMDILSPLIDEYKDHDVVLVGGCALNVLFNQILYEELSITGRKLYVPPNPNDCGLALGQFLLHNKIHPEDLHYNGWELLDYNKLDDYVTKRNARKIKTPEIVSLLKSGKLIGMVTGCSEVGPRALGNRSIICDPSFPDMKDILNSKVKFREWYRPFAPVARLENASKYFNNVFESKYMSFAPTVKAEYEEELSAITHIDKTSRLQTVTEDQHKGFYEILKELDNQGHVSVILNTSFNILGNPILTKIEDALHVLDNTELDYVIVDDYLFGE